MKSVYITMTQRAIGLLTGLSLIAVGIIVDTRSTIYLAFITPSTSINPLSISLSVVGILIFIVGFFGCCVATKTCFNAIITVAVALGCILVAEVAAVTTTYVYRHQIWSYIQSAWLASLHDYRSSNQEIVTAWDYTQQQFSCCGVMNYTDWTDVHSQSNSSVRLKLVPDSCCFNSQVVPRSGCRLLLPPGLDTDQPASNLITNTTQRFFVIFEQGCAAAVLSWVADNTTITTVSAVYLAFVQLIALFLTLSLARNIRVEFSQSVYSGQRSSQLKLAV